MIHPVGLILKVKNIYLKGRTLLIGDGRRIDFWHDCWNGSSPLCNVFSELGADPTGANVGCPPPPPPPPPCGMA